MADAKRIECSFETHSSFEKLNVTLDNLNLIYDFGYQIYGDVFVDGEIYNEELTICATFYDSENNIMYESSTYIDLNKIVDFKTFNIFCGNENSFYNPINMIKIYPEVEKIKPVPAKELRKKIERISQFEEKLGITIKKMGVKVERSSIEIMGDIFIDNDADKGISLNATLYDEDENIIDVASTEIMFSAFLGFETFSIAINGINPENIDKITLYPKVIN